MSDLISRQHLLDDMLHDLDCYEIDDKSKENLYLRLVDVARMIKGQPAAYDVDKIVEQLNEYPHGYLNVETMTDIIEIVQKGGIS